MNAPEVVGLPVKHRALPQDGRAEVWLTDLSRLPLDAGPSGLSRKERILKRRIQQKFLLRLLLGAYLQCPGKSVRLVRDDRGKPALSGEHANSGLSFNVSHAGAWLAVAVGRDAALGVDIESERRLPRAVSMARRFFSADEADWLQRQDEPFLSRHFLQQWTGREALVKARGSGLAGALGRIELGWQPATIRRLPEEWPEPARWSLLPLDLPDGLVGHVAAEQSTLATSIVRLDPTT